MTRPSYAVVLTHDRPGLLARCVDAIAPQVDHVIVVDNASDPPVLLDSKPPNTTVVYVPDQPPNLARLWNRQLDVIASRRWPRRPWDVALLCDDVEVPAGWFACVSDAMRAHDAAAASTHSYAPAPRPYVLTELTNGADRMCPWAFMLPGEKGLRADESMRWWYCDTDLDWQARLSGGTVVAAGPVAVNQLVGDFTARRVDLSLQAHRDGATFNAKWGL